VHQLELPYIRLNKKRAFSLIDHKRGNWRKKEDKKEEGYINSHHFIKQKSLYVFLC
jgi:hypothetical protein